jgi:hypothetical protein
MAVPDPVPTPSFASVIAESVIKSVLTLPMPIV